MRISLLVAIAAQAAAFTSRAPPLRAAARPLARSARDRAATYTPSRGAGGRGRRDGFEGIGAVWTRQRPHGSRRRRGRELSGAAGTAGSRDADRRTRKARRFCKKIDASNARATAIHRGNPAAASSTSAVTRKRAVPGGRGKARRFAKGIGASDARATAIHRRGYAAELSRGRDAEAAGTRHPKTKRATFSAGARAHGPVRLVVQEKIEQGFLQTETRRPRRLRHGDVRAAPRGYEARPSRRGRDPRPRHRWSRRRVRRSTSGTRRWSRSTPCWPPPSGWRWRTFAARICL